MTKEEIWVIARRFLRGFLAGGLASSAAMLATGATVSNLEDLKQFAFALATAFVSGGLLAIDKLLRWQDEPQAE